MILIACLAVVAYLGASFLHAFGRIGRDTARYLLAIIPVFATLLIAVIAGSGSIVPPLLLIGSAASAFGVYGLDHDRIPV